MVSGSSLAVAGFSEDDLTVTIEDRQLVVRGRMAEPDEDRVFLHRGIAGRAFQRSFVLADGVEVVAASMENGLLHVDLRRVATQQVVRPFRSAANKGIIMDTKFDFSETDAANNTVYIRSVETSTLPHEIREQIPGVEILYAMCDADGERLALVRDRSQAFMLARQNELTPGQRSLNRARTD